MRPIALSLILAAIAGPARAAESPPSCLDKAMTQGELNDCAAGDLRSADEQLNAVYQAVLARHRDDGDFIRNLQAAQSAWLAWRDAEIKAVFPDRESGNGGSALPMCWAGELEQLTRERTKRLQLWLDGVTEGDVCGVPRPRGER